MLRSIAIWQRNRWIIIFFLVVGCGLWGVQMHGVTTVRASWDPLLATCNVESVTGIYLTLVYLYTMFTDLSVLIVTLAGLSWSPGRSGLWRMLWDQGISFFIVAFIANLIPAVMLLVNLNPVINIVRSTYTHINFIPSNIFHVDVLHSCYCCHRNLRLPLLRRSQ